MMYALGQLDIRDQDFFDRLSNIIVDGIANADSQTIANALWAYQAVYLPPPQNLINHWAQGKLGLVVPVQPVDH